MILVKGKVVLYSYVKRSSHGADPGL